MLNVLERINTTNDIIYTQKQLINSLYVDDMFKQNPLASNLSGLGLEVDAVEGDGNRCFVSFIRQIYPIFGLSLSTFDISYIWSK
jgi:uncharacterized secreted protein with C-terminal beta-propeller domain